MSHVPELDWLPDDGVMLTRGDLERILTDLRALVDGTEPLEPNRAHTVDIARTVVRAIERGEGA